jgi:hypothetical protein
VKSVFGFLWPRQRPEEFLVVFSELLPLVARATDGTEVRLKGGSVVTGRRAGGFPVCTSEALGARKMGRSLARSRSEALGAKGILDDTGDAPPSEPEGAGTSGFLQKRFGRLEVNKSNSQVFIEGRYFF